MFQAFGFVMHFVPRHAEYLMQHAFDEVMAGDKLPRDLASIGSELNAAILAHGDQAVALQSPQSHGDSGRRHGEPMGQASGDHLFAFALGFQNGLEVVFFGNCDHMLARIS